MARRVSGFTDFFKQNPKTTIGTPVATSALAWFGFGGDDPIPAPGTQINKAPFNQRTPKLFEQGESNLFTGNRRTPGQAIQPSGNQSPINFRALPANHLLPYARQMQAQGNPLDMEGVDVAPIHELARQLQTEPLDEWDSEFTRAELSDDSRTQELLRQFEALKPNLEDVPEANWMGALKHAFSHYNDNPEESGDIWSSLSTFLDGVNSYGDHRDEIQRRNDDALRQHELAVLQAQLKASTARQQEQADVNRLNVTGENDFNRSREAHEQGGDQVRAQYLATAGDLLAKAGGLQQGDRQISNAGELGWLGELRQALTAGQGAEHEIGDLDTRQNQIRDASWNAIEDRNQRGQIAGAELDERAYATDLGYELDREKLDFAAHDANQKNLLGADNINAQILAQNREFSEMKDKEFVTEMSREIPDVVSRNMTMSQAETSIINKMLELQGDPERVGDLINLDQWLQIINHKNSSFELFGQENRFSPEERSLEEIANSLGV